MLLLFVDAVVYFVLPVPTELKTQVGADGRGVLVGRIFFIVKFAAIGHNSDILGHIVPRYHDLPILNHDVLRLVLLKRLVQVSLQIEPMVIFYSIVLVISIVSEILVPGLARDG